MKAQTQTTNLKELTSEEENIIVNKNTELPYSGEYDDFNEKGSFVCKRCSSPLYSSIHKFDARCGWPAFDKEEPGAVTKTPDSDGLRTEISCSNCGAHLGHVFEGERFTKENTRHCVNSVSLMFVPANKGD